MPALNKALGEIVAADIQALVDQAWVEDELLEFKRTLSHSSSGSPDRWLNDQSDIGQAAKRDVLAEVVAMANTYGGDVIVGIDETAEKPPRARSIHALPACVELASRLEMAARDLIKPQVPMLAVKGVPTGGAKGVVIFRVPKSRLAPHRLEMKGVEKECYRRVGDRTEPMTMREIQDLTFAIARGLDAIDRCLEAAIEEFEAWYRAGPSNGRRRGFMVAAVPMSADIYLDRVHGNSAVRAVCGEYRARLRPTKEFALELHPVAQPSDYRPVLRGTQAQLDHERHQGRLQRVGCDGAILDMSRLDASSNETSGPRSEHSLHPGWFFGTVGNVLQTIDRFRGATNAQAVQFAMEICVAATDACPVYSWSSSWHQPAGSFPKGVTRFPRYQVGERDTWVDTLTLMHRDFWNSIGVDDDAGNRLEIAGL